MANKTTRPATAEEVLAITDLIRTGFMDYHPNDRIAEALLIEANLGLRICDILKLTMNDIYWDGHDYRFDSFTETKTSKKRRFLIPTEVVEHLRSYCKKNGIADDDRIFPVSERLVEKQLKRAADYLGLEGIGTHSFRKFFAHEIYVRSDYDIVLVQTLLQHSSSAITQRYIQIENKRQRDALVGHIIGI